MARKKNIVTWQNVREVYTKPCGEHSPYWAWMEFSMAKEVDNIPMPNDIEYDPLLDSVLEALNNGAEDLMSDRERKAFHFVIRMGYSYPLTAKKMHITNQAVQTLITRAVKKLRILASIHAYL